MIVDCVADLHGHYPELEGGDLLIVAGDLTKRNLSEEYIEFTEWLCKQEYKKIITIAGNHDNYREKYPPAISSGLRIEYLCDSGTEFEGFKIWGSPWTLTFEGMNPKCKAFTLDNDHEAYEEEDTKWWPKDIKQPSLADKWALIPNDTDILITHMPPYDILDEVLPPNDYSFRAGSKSLLKRVCEIKPRLHVFGHIHEGYGDMIAEWDHPNTVFVNASHVNEYYEPVNKPIRVIL